MLRETILLQSQKKSTFGSQVCESIMAIYTECRTHILSNYITIYVM